jgi:hypothetical protein
MICMIEYTKKLIMRKYLIFYNSIEIDKVLILNKNNNVLLSFVMFSVKTINYIVSF